MNWMSKQRKQLCLGLLLGLWGINTAVNAAELLALGDAELAGVQGRGGLSFAMDLHSSIGSMSYTTTDAAGNPSSISLNNFVATGAIFETFDIVAGASGEPDVANWAFPYITSSKPLQVSYDLAIMANGSTLGTGLTLKNIAFAGSSVQWTTSRTLGGVAWGLALNLAIDQVLLQPNGRGNTAGQMSLSGIKLEAAGGGGPWVIANVATQTGAFNILADPGGDRLQLGIGWPVAPADAASGSLKIDNITFTTPGGNVDLGSSSIGSMQIQYLNIKIKS